MLLARDFLSQLGAVDDFLRCAFTVTILKVNEVNALAIGGHTQPELTLSLKTNHKNIQWRPTGIHKKPK